MTATRDGSEASLYLNGKWDGAASYSFTATDKGQGLKIGAYGTGPWGFFKGVIDDVRIYNTALNAEQVEALYEQSLQ